MKKFFTKGIILSLCSILATNSVFAQLTGTINIGTGQTYTTLTGTGGLFDAINTGTVTGNIVAQIASDITEPGTVTLNKWVESGLGNYQIRIVPDGNTERVLSGSGTNMINLSNVRNLVIDGSFSGTGKFLRFINTNKAANTLAFINDCKSDTIRNCYFEGVDTTANKSVILIGATNITGGTGNDSIAILNNIIKDNSAGYPKNLIRSVGSSASPNDNGVISGNEFINWSNEAMGLTDGTGNNWKILNNAFYQSSNAAINTQNIYGICLTTNSGDEHIISGNSIGGTAPDRSGAALKSTGTGTYSIIGISLSGPNSSPVSITKNSISNIIGKSINGIYAENTNTIIDSNFIDNIKTVAAVDITDNVSLTGIEITSSNAAITNNTVRKISQLTSSFFFPPGATVGIRALGNSQVIIDGNEVDSMLSSYCSQNSNFANTVLAAGIVASLSGTPTSNKISNNKISNIINLNCFSAIGISYICSNTSTTNIFNNHINRIEGLSSTSGTYNTLIGIEEAGAGSDTIYNNMINMGVLSSAAYIYGIRNSGNGAHVYYNNTVNITTQNNQSSGTAPTTTAPFYRVSGNVLLRNNILSNKRTTYGGGPSIQRSIAIQNETTSSTGLNSDYNLLATANAVCIALGTSYKTFADWKAVSQGDSNSLNATVKFVSPTDLHIDGTNTNAWNVYGRGIAIPAIGTDIDGDNRSTTVGTHVTIGADEIPVPTSTPLPIDLEKFTAKNIGNKNRIDWSTAKEAKGDYFELESSTDARTFNKIAKINAKGQPSVYTYWDEKAVLGTNYYRLKMTMDNGSFVYSKTVSADVRSLSGFAIRVYPNPVQDKVALTIDGSIQNSAIITITNIAGKLLKTIDVTKNEMEIDMTDISKGTYFIKYADEHQNHTVKITKQ